MNGQALSETALQAALHDIRLPAQAPGGAVAELFAVIALAAFLALVIGSALRPFLTLRQSKPDLSRQLDALEALPEAEQRRSLLVLLKQHDPAYVESLRARLYRPETAPDTAELRAALARHA